MMTPYKILHRKLYRKKNSTFSFYSRYFITSIHSRPSPEPVFYRTGWTGMGTSLWYAVMKHDHQKWLSANGEKREETKGNYKNEFAQKILSCRNIHTGNKKDSRQAVRRLCVSSFIPTYRRHPGLRYSNYGQIYDYLPPNMRLWMFCNPLMHDNSSNNKLRIIESY